MSKSSKPHSSRNEMTWRTGLSSLTGHHGDLCDQEVGVSRAPRRTRVSAPSTSSLARKAGRTH
jgi:hypothetical protein